MLKQWTQARLNELLQADFEGHKLIVVSNRQPYSHFYTEEGLIRHCRPSSGMVTALEPIMNACGGLWIAQGNSGADRDVVDERTHVAVPPDSPRYDLRRVWLTREQIEGHYNGASNQGLWPLCHMTFNKPVFSAAHWDSYRDVNEAFAQAVLEGSDGRPAVVLVQDYHYALVPRLLKEADPNPIVAHA